MVVQFRSCGESGGAVFGEEALRPREEKKWVLPENVLLDYSVPTTPAPGWVHLYRPSRYSNLQSSTSCARLVNHPAHIHERAQAAALPIQACHILRIHCLSLTHCRIAFRFITYLLELLAIIRLVFTISTLSVPPCGLMAFHCR